MTGFEKLQKLSQEKNSHIILGLDPNKEMEKDIYATNYGIENYLKWLIDQTHEHIVGIKPNLAFYENSNNSRLMMARLMDYAQKHYGLVTILDVKHGDIGETQKEWASADIKNFKPDIVTINSYMGYKDTLLPYFNLDPNICAFVLTATSNPDAREFQDSITNGIKNYQKMALLVREADVNRVGYVIGSTKPDAVVGVRAIEKQYNLQPAPVLAPGFGKQGGDLSFAGYAGENAFYPISSGLTKSAYLNGLTPNEAAKKWKEIINEQIAKNVYMQSITEQIIDKMVENDIIWVAKSPEIQTWKILKKGRDKLAANGITIPSEKDIKEKVFQELLANGVLNKKDFGAIFIQIRDVMKNPEVLRLLAHLYAKQIKESGLEFHNVGAVAYGAIDMGALVASYLNKPSFLVRKKGEDEATHSRILGELKEGQTAIMIEDVLTSGGSLIKDVEYLRETTGANINDAFVFVAREPSGLENCKKKDINVHYQMDMPQLKEFLFKSPKVGKSVKEIVREQE